MQTAELLKDLPCRDSNHFSKYSQGVYKLSEVKKYIKLKQYGDSDQAQVIEMDQQSLLRRDMEKLKETQSRPVPTKRQKSEDPEDHHKKLRRTESPIRQ